MSDAAGPVSGGFTEEEDRLHVAGIAAIRDALAGGLDFAAACGRIAGVGEELRRIIADDYLKVSLAEMHFQGGRSTQEVAAALRAPLQIVEQARCEMLAEVAAASVDVFRRQSGQGQDA